ncbi:MAG: ABC transporter ATP-binding protein [Actinobacteria bacterium]|nr:ABC transporter ATP-binding protein [Actinomycetota bacterium]
MRDFWELNRLVFRLSLGNSRSKTYTAIAFMFAGNLAMPLIAVALRFFINAMLGGDPAGAAIAGTSLVVAWIAQLTFWHFGYRFYFDLLDLNRISFEEELLQLVDGPPTIGHAERADFADKLEVVRTDAGQIYWSFSILVGCITLVLQIVLTAVILALLAPELLAVPVFAVPALLAGQWAQRAIDARREQTAERRRLSRHLLSLFASPGAAKEIRSFGLQRYLPARQAALWREISAEQWRAEARGMLASAGGQAVFALAYIAALLFLVARSISGHATIGDVLLVVALTGQINQQLSQVLGRVLALGQLSRAAGRFRWLREQAGPVRAEGTPPPTRLERGIEFRDVSFTYPGADKAALTDVTVLIPAGAIIGIVGDNGSGKSTLLKLLAGMYRPDAGAVLVDGTDLADIDPAGWRSRMSAAFQDFQRLELVARESVGTGDLPRIEDVPVVAGAIARATDSDLVATLPGGLETQLGKGYGDGHELSGGQWQTVALARSMMRDAPLVLILDEPTASLDAHNEYVLFERYAEQARRVAHSNGGICVLVSHRFSTVRMADEIIVMEGGRITETGSHDALMTRGGLYASLYLLQAAGYR